MSKASDWVHTSRLEVQVLQDCSRQTIRKRRNVFAVETWEKVKRLGQGGYAEVYLERCAEDRQKLRAVKQLPKRNNIDYHRELEAVALFSQKLYDGAFVQSFGWYETPIHVFVTMEYLPHGDLRSHMHAAFPELEARRIVGQVLEGLNFMHERDFIHRDLKPENILVHERGPQWWVKITDFGISKRARDGDETLRTQVYTPQFVAPEVLFVKGSYSRSVDIWPTGIIAFLLLTGDKAVFPTQPDLLQYWQHAVPLPVERLCDCNVSDLGRSFIARLLSPDPKDRPDATTCLKDTWQRTEGGSYNSPSNSSGESVDSIADGVPSARWTANDNDQPITAMPLGVSKTVKSKDSVSPRIFPHDLSGILPPESVSAQAMVRADSSSFIQNRRDAQANHANDKYNETPPHNYRHVTAKEHNVHAIASKLESKRSNKIAGPKSSEVGHPVQPAMSSDVHWRGKIWLCDHEAEVKTVAFSPNGRLVASGSSDTVSLWDVRSGELINQLQGYEAWVQSVAFSPSERLLASGSENGDIILYDIPTGDIITRLQASNDGVLAVAFSPDGEFIASGSRDNTLTMWATTTKKEVNKLSGHKSWVKAVAFSPDGLLIASGSDDKSVRLWNVKSGEELRRLQGHVDQVHAVAFSLSGKLLASGSADETIKLWQVASGTQSKSLSGHDSWVTAVAFSPDETLVASASYDGTWRLWDVANGTQSKLFMLSSIMILSIAFSPDGRLVATGGSEGGAVLWDLTSPDVASSEKGDHSAQNMQVGRSFANRIRTLFR